MARRNHEFLYSMHEVYGVNGNGNGGSNGKVSEKSLPRTKIRAQLVNQIQAFVDHTKEQRYLRGLAKRNGTKSGDQPAKTE